MKWIAPLQWIIVVAIPTALISCDKNYTVFYEDEDADGLSVFSDMGNNVMSCYINGQAFRTRGRIYNAGFSRGYLSTEIELFKDAAAPDSDTLTIIWQRDAFSPNPNSISLVLAVKKDFSYNDFTAFNNTRLVIDGINGYFMVNSNHSEKGTGSIYFLRAVLMPGNAAGINNQLSGIFEATLPSYKITRGRFDHTLPVGHPQGVVFF
ncbi:hypothetical protein [Agriterribacter sp.]|uniref:hypothetical protein n=1 Tax=Agriterribacter sp. TaxID=2821509 RepID=UPI002BF9178E|nr:hypothetical protein [Agriterribacter sp.]HRO45635.1 hypothetical protein [Agriterribacter sp.]HRQ17456.1 hypothetical protein [Agriterribacter sp.]